MDYDCLPRKPKETNQQQQQQNENKDTTACSINNSQPNEDDQPEWAGRERFKHENMAVVNEAHLSPLAAAEQRRLASDVTVWPHSRLRPEEEQSGKCAAAEQ